MHTQTYTESNAKINKNPKYNNTIFGCYFSLSSSSTRQHKEGKKTPNEWKEWKGMKMLSMWKEERDGWWSFTPLIKWLNRAINAREIYITIICTSTQNRYGSYSIKYRMHHGWHDMTSVCCVSCVRGREESQSRLARIERDQHYM